MCCVVNIFGDLNSRTEEYDFIEGVDHVPPREILDFTNNAYGNGLIDFLVDSRMCMLNGRMGRNDFTCVSTRGKSVVDYAIVPHEQLPSCSDFTVSRLSQLIQERGLCVPDKIPDHSLLEWTIDLCGYDIVHDEPSVHFHNFDRVKSWNVNKIPSSFLSDSGTVEKISNTIRRIEQTLQNDCEINKAYDEFVSLITSTLDETCGVDTSRDTAIHREKTRSRAKPYWNSDLQDHWNMVCVAEKEWVQCKQPVRKRFLREKYCSFRRTFDRLNRKYKREFQLSEQRNLLELMNGQDSRDFWQSMLFIRSY